MMKSTTERKRAPSGFATTGWMNRIPSGRFVRGRFEVGSFGLCSDGLGELFGVPLYHAKAVRVVLYRKPRENAVGIEVRVCNLGCCLSFYRQDGEHLLNITPSNYSKWTGFRRFVEKLDTLGREQRIPLYATLEVRS
jgi:hypothetical protein